MMGNDEGGGGGCSSSSGEKMDERPLKKARYVWEVKGKYHLKPTLQGGGRADQEQPAEGAAAAAGDRGARRAGGAFSSNNNDEACTDSCCIESFLARTHSLLMDTDDDEEPVPRNIDSAISNEIPITLVSPNPKNRDYYIRKWQARQLARAYIDNNINRVLESWIVAATFDASDLVENCDNDGQVEDEGILMAIQSHGLQRNELAYVKPTDAPPNNETTTSPKHTDEIVKQDVVNTNENQQLDDVLNSSVFNPQNLDFLDAAVCVAIKKKGLSSCKNN